MTMLTKWMHSRFGGKRGFVLYCKHSFLQLVFRRYEKYLHLPDTPVKRVVFVCKGNICRSAFAEAVFKSVSDLPVVSFGLDTTTGCPPHPPVAKIASEMGYDMSQHQTTNITEFKPLNNDLYVCMEVDHAKIIRSYFSHSSSILLGATGVPASVHIHDPYSGVEKYIEYTLEYICLATKRLGAALKEDAV